jgi:hypothetical protein
VPQAAATGSVDRVIRMACRPRWLPRHVLMVIIVAAFSLLGRWQWDVSDSQRGGLQNMLYALQWWAMAAIVIYGWWRLLHDDAYPPPVVGDSAALAGVEGSTLAAGGDGSSWPPVSRRRVSTVELIDAQLATADGETAAGETDEDLARYNEYLAWLNRRAERAH